MVDTTHSVERKVNDVVSLRATSGSTRVDQGLEECHFSIVQIKLDLTASWNS
jgi:hypothetical protein